MKLRRPRYLIRAGFGFRDELWRAAEMNARHNKSKRKDATRGTSFDSLKSTVSNCPKFAKRQRLQIRKQTKVP